MGHLYLLGALFGLYEGVVTRVLWFGYPNSEGPIFGTIGGAGGIAILEYLTLIFFWHPIFAFILPILVYEVLILKEGENTTGIFPSHIPWLRKTRKNKVVFALLTLTGSLFLSLSLNYDPIPVTISILGTLAIFIAPYLVSRKFSCPTDIRGFELGKKGFSVLFIYMIIGLYVPMWFIMDVFYPRPSIFGIFLYVLSYVCLISLFWCYPRITDRPKLPPAIHHENRGKAFFNPRVVMLSWLLLMALSIPYAIIHPGITLLATMVFISMPVVGFVLFVQTVYSVLKTCRFHKPLYR